MRCTFKVGQKVVCVVREHDWRSMPFNMPVCGPARNSICTITGLVPTDFRYADDGAEMIGVRIAGFGLDMFADRCFRPIDRKKRSTSIEVFKKLLQPMKRTVKITDYEDA